VIAASPDCVLYMPRQLDADDVCRLLASGIDVVTTRGEFHHPPSTEPALRDRVEAACAAGGSSLHSTGSSPGFITEAVPIVLTSIQRRLDRLTIDEFADLSRRDSPDLLFTIMGFGRPPEAFGEARLQHGRTSFGPSLRALADALGMPLDDIQAGGEVAVASRDIEIAAGTVEAGSVAAQRLTVSGLRDGDRCCGSGPTGTARPSSTRHGTCCPRAGACPSRATRRWRWISVSRSPSSRWPSTRPATPPIGPSTPFRSCAARPGILTTADLPQVVAALGSPLRPCDLWSQAD
jgi:4-hydroxy-tetrahydrodipicolinate reductase